MKRLLTDKVFTAWRACASAGCQALQRMQQRPASELLGASVRIIYPDEEAYLRAGKKAYEGLRRRGWAATSS